MLGQGPCLDGTAVGHHACRQGIRRLAGHDHLAAVGHDHLLVLHQGLYRGRLHRHLQIAVGAAIQGDTVPSRQHHIA